MPDLRLRDVHLPELHLPELHLPEMSRDDIVRAFGDARREADLGRFDPRRVEAPQIDLPKIDLPRIDLTKVDLSRIDVPRAIATAAQAAGVVRAARRPRWPFVLGGLFTLTIIGVAIATSPQVRPRLEALGRRARERMEARRDAQRVEATAIDDRETPIAIPIEPAAFRDVETSPMTDPEIADAVEGPTEVASA